MTSLQHLLVILMETFILLSLNVKLMLVNWGIPLKIAAYVLQLLPAMVTPQQLKGIAINIPTY